MPKRTRSPRLASRQAGFTMIEVLIAMLVAMVGLLGTVAVQQTLLAATATANDGAVALRLAAQALEEFNTRVVQPGAVPIDRMRTVADGNWTPYDYLNAAGQPAAAPSPAARWQRRTRVVDLGVGQPYNVSVQVNYTLNTGATKIVQLDMEKRK